MCALCHCRAFSLSGNSEESHHNTSAHTRTIPTKLNDTPAITDSPITIAITAMGKAAVCTRMCAIMRLLYIYLRTHATAAVDLEHAHCIMKSLCQKTQRFMIRVTFVAFAMGPWMGFLVPARVRERLWQNSNCGHATPSTPKTLLSYPVEPKTTPRKSGTGGIEVTGVWMHLQMHVHTAV